MVNIFAILPQREKHASLASPERGEGGGTKIIVAVLYSVLQHAWSRVILKPTCSRILPPMVKRKRGNIDVSSPPFYHENWGEGTATRRLVTFKTEGCLKDELI